MVVLTHGRFAGHKAVIVKNVDDGNTSRPYGHALVAGIANYPRKARRPPRAASGAEERAGGSAGHPGTALSGPELPAGCAAASQHRREAAAPGTAAVRPSWVRAARTGSVCRPTLTRALTHRSPRR